MPSALSMSMEPKPTRRASRSLFSCLDVVPEATSEWKPEMAPQATVTNRAGKRYWPLTSKEVKAGSSMTGCAATMPTTAASIMA